MEHLIAVCIIFLAIVALLVVVNFIAKMPPKWAVTINVLCVLALIGLIMYIAWSSHVVPHHAIMLAPRVLYRMV